MIPIYKGQTEADVFDPNARDNIFEPLIRLKELFALQGYNLYILGDYEKEKPDRLLFYNCSDTKLLTTLYRADMLKNSIYVSLEPPLVDPMHTENNMKRLSNIFGAVMTWQDDLVDNKKFFKIYVPMPKKDKSFDISFCDKKLITFISSNFPKKQWYKPKSLYGKRVEAIEYFQQKCPDQFDFYGKRWSKEQYPAYKGLVEHKDDVLKNYKFAICFENMEKVDGYVTEKIFDCFYADCVPVYWGPDNIEKYVPKNCFVDFRDFSDFDALYDHLINMTEEEYNDIITNIRAYLNSSMYAKFLPEQYFNDISNAFKAIEQKEFNFKIAKKEISWLKKRNVKIFFKRCFGKIKRILRIARPT